MIVVKQRPEDLDPSLKLGVGSDVERTTCS